MKIIGVIPARYASTRLPAKPLHPILGKPLLQWVIEGAQKSQQLHELLVATDHEGIAQLAQTNGVEAVMTEPSLPSGSDRVWAAIKNRDCDIVINIQGDEPLIDEHWLDPMIQLLKSNSQLDMATLGRPLDHEALASTQTAKIVLNHRHEAIYFSRFPIPFSRESAPQDLTGTSALKHIGMYTYRKNFLKYFCEQPPAEIERFEGLEQLRALYLGARIGVAKVDFDSWGVDTPEDIKNLEKRLQTR